MDQADAFSVIEQAAWESDRLIETMGLHINELESALAAAQAQLEDSVHYSDTAFRRIKSVLHNVPGTVPASKEADRYLALA